MYKIAVLFCFTLIATSCSKEDAVVDRSTPVEARISYDGDPAVDGCGFVLIVGSEAFHPLNLSEDFQVDGIDVLVEYTNTNNAGPFCWGSLVSVEIHSIELF